MVAVTPSFPPLPMLESNPGFFILSLDGIPTSAIAGRQHRSEMRPRQISAAGSQLAGRHAIS
jgi:hypothetical protein